MPDPYQQTWDALADTRERALAHVAGTTDEDALASSARHTLEVLHGEIGIRSEDTFLEIGCGVGRVGTLLAPRIQRWIGCDVSAAMLGHARARLDAAGIRNADLVPTDGATLRPIPDASVDAVYCTVVFMHLEPWERYGYCLEAARVLRPGGRFYADAINLLHDEGWAIFEAGRAIPAADRPQHLSRCSTPDELHAYLRRAGFEGIRISLRHLWVQGSAVRPGR